MSPIATEQTQDAAAAQPVKAATRPPILYRVPTSPPLVTSAHGIYMEIEGGRTVVDGVGGAAVTCIGNGHPKVIQAIKDQADKLSCKYITRFIYDLYELACTAIIDYMCVT